MKKINFIIVCLLLFFGMASYAPVVYASNASDAVCEGIGLGNIDSNGVATGSGCDTSGSQKVSDVVVSAVSLLSILAGLIAIIMVIVGGFKYITSGGDSNAIGAAKKTIIYALVGLIVAALAQVLVHFVLQRLVNDTPPATETTLPKRP